MTPGLAIRRAGKACVLLAALAVSCAPAPSPPREPAAPAPDAGPSLVLRNLLGSRGASVQRPVALAPLPAGQILVADAGLFQVARFADRGQEMGRLGSNAEARFESPVDVATGPSLSIYVLAGDSSQRRLDRYDFAGNPTGTILRMPDPDTPSDLSDPRGIAVDGTGAIYVSDAERDRVLVFGEAGEARFEFGLYGSAPGSFMDPWGLAFDARRDRLYVADSGNARVQVFDRLGVSLASWPLEEGSRPAGLAVDDAGRVWVADPGTNRILAFDHEGRLLVAASSGEGFGPFRGPLDVAAGAGNLVIVADSGSGRVGVFAPHPALGGAKGP